MRPRAIPEFTASKTVNGGSSRERSSSSIPKYSNDETAESHTRSEREVLRLRTELRYFLSVAVSIPPGSRLIDKTNPLAKG